MSSESWLVIEQRARGFLRFRVCWTFGVAGNHPQRWFRTRAAAERYLERKRWTELPASSASREETL